MFIKSVLEICTCKNKYNIRLFDRDGHSIDTDGNKNLLPPLSLWCEYIETGSDEMFAEHYLELSIYQRIGSHGGFVLTHHWKAL